MRPDPHPLPDPRAEPVRPADLAAGEIEVADLFDRGAAAPPEDLGGRVLGAYHPPEASRFRLSRRRFVPVALLLLALAGGAVAWVSRAARDAKVEARARRGTPAGAEAVVLDDPHVPLYRGLEDFRSLDIGRPDEDELAASCGELEGR